MAPLWLRIELFVALVFQSHVIYFLEPSKRIHGDRSLHMLILIKIAACVHYYLLVADNHHFIIPIVGAHHRKTHIA